jgi:GFO/IDH/MocA oxidoreductase family protein
MFGVAFYGEKGSIAIDGASYKVYDETCKEVGKFTGSGSDAPHQQNFLDCIRDGKRPNAGHKSTMLCHLGNIAYRTGHTLKIDPKKGHILDDKQAEALWRREYRPGWEPKV